MEKLKSNKRGITLIALVITIIVLLILAGISIAMLTGDNGLLTKASQAKTLTQKANWKEQIELAVMTAMMKDDGIGGIDGTILEEELAKAGITADMIEKSPADANGSTLPWVISVDGYKFEIQEDGSVKEKIVVPVTSLEVEDIEIAQGERGKLTVTTTPSEDIEDLEYTSSNTGVATVDRAGNVSVAESATIGTTVTITVKGTISGKTATCTVIVGEPKGLQVGDYVEYNVTYTDMYSKYEFKATDGWRVLDLGDYDETTKTATGVKLISTGVPAKLYYYVSSVKNFEKDAVGTYGKWAGDSAQRAAYKEAFYGSSSNDNENMYVAAGLYYNFGKIKFSQGTTAERNEGYYTQVNDKTTGNLSENEFIAEGASEVHNLTLAELNKAVGRTDLTSTSEVSTNLFYLRGLNKYGYTSSSNPYYWLASPDADDTSSVWYVSHGGYISYSNIYTIGVRPVVSLSSEVYKDGGVWKIR